MSETKATRGSGSGLSLNLNNSITHCSRHFRGHLNRGVWERGGKTAGMSTHIFPAVDAAHGNKYKSLLSPCLELVLVYLIIKRKKEKKVSLKIAGRYQAAALRQKKEPLKITK